MITGVALERWLQANWVGWQEPWNSEFIPFQERHGYPRHVVVEWCGGLLMEGIWSLGGTYGAAMSNTTPNCWYTPTGAAGFQNWGRWTTTPTVHSFVFFDWGATGLGNNVGVIDHIGFVTAVGNGYVDTIEGNVNERCGRFRRWLSSGVIKGFGLPQWQTAPIVPPVVQEPKPDLLAIRNVLAASAVAAAT